ncbi:BTAD domain-containing putative transcriptional regulator [Sphaerisporangium sp. TRM90804]|uniref:AfsR/SARP family transcriptional regulator n=1 Tax=Sphaerisporangium sp. TRM90804 TaxID=3031113 RepID=UPI0024476169|nr:BTAD domain-containing putative transcriptional regulator [Sphaerisporangium sp. TRM90804]MDH2430706.1 BTAD domain-containing putative transcriptional regulator [Sphaerisporangium sp. TRM90804]
MEFRLLGPVEAWHEGVRLALGGPKPRALLAALLLEPGRVVSAERLIDLLWDERPPGSARALIQTYVSTLRRRLGEANGEEIIETRPPGYLIRLRDEQLDRLMFGRLVEEGRQATGDGRHAEAARALGAALALWRGEALGGIGDVLRSEAAALDQKRLDVTEERIAAELLTGRYGGSSAELRAMVAAHPLRERARGQLMTALYGLGRQSEALTVYHEGRRALSDELGIDPGPELRRLYEMILRGEPATPNGAPAGHDTRPTKAPPDRTDLIEAPAAHTRLPAASPAPTRPFAASPAPLDAPPARARPAGAPAAREHPAASPPTRTRPAGAPPAEAGPVEWRPEVVPAQLPPCVADFTGRTAVAGDIAGRLAAPGHGPPVFVICGKAGVGKSALAVFAAHAAAGAYPHGQLFVDLRGCTDSPATSQEILARFLRALGVAPASLPESFQERLDLYRSILSRRRVLIVLDDARSERQVRPLLPGGRGCAVLVTSRGRFPGLDGAQAVDLDVLEEAAATELLASIVGRERIAAEPQAAARIVHLCGRLPLAIRTAGGRLATRRHWPLTTLVERLSDERRRLDELSAGDLEVRSSVAFSYRLLDEEAKKAFRRLGTLGVSDFPSWIVAPLLDLPVRDAEDVVERLVDAQLLDHTAVDAVGQVRYRLHDLLRVYAYERAEAEEPAETLREAVSRVLGQWLYLVAHVAERTPPGEIQLRREYATARPVSGELALRLLADPVAWLETETPALIAAIERAAAMDLDVAACDVAVALSFSVFFVRNRLAEWSRSHTAALAAARRAGNRMGEAMLLAAHGQICYEMDQYEQTGAYFRQALALFTEAGDVRGQAVVLAGLGGAYRESSRLREAIGHLNRSAAVFRTLGDDAAIGQTARLAASVHLELGDYDVLPAMLGQALDAYRRVGSKRGEALTLRTIGLAHRAVGDHARAEELSSRALRLFQEVGDRFMSAYAVQAVAKARIRQGTGDSTRPCLREALALCHVQGDRWGEALIRRTIGELHLAAGRWEPARVHLEEAIAMSDALNTPLASARARRDLAAVLELTGEAEGARLLLDRANEVFARYEAREHVELTKGEGPPSRLDLPE